MGYFDTGNGGDLHSADVAGISSHPSGRLYLADSGIDALPEFNGANLFETSVNGDQVHREIAAATTEPTGITFNSFDGYFYVTDNSDAKLVTRYDDNLNTPRFQFSPTDDLTTATDPQGIASDPATGTLYVADGSRGGRQVLTYGLDLSDPDEAGRGVNFEGVFSVADNLQSVDGIAFHQSSGHLFLIDGTQDRIFEYTTTGTLLEQYDLSGFSPPPVSPQGLTFAPTSDSSDHSDAVSLYIADAGVDATADGRVYEATIGISDADATSITFRAMADVPNDDAQREALEAELESLGPDDEFFIHLGDIHSPHHCLASSYEYMETSLKSSALPVFIIPGDNEWNDCSDTELAWTRWESHLMRLEEHWSHGLTVLRQDVREENFAFVRSGVLFIGINLVGGTVHDANEWSQRMTDNANWVNENFSRFGDQVNSATIFAHAFADPSGGDRQQFALDFVDAAQDFEKPILYMQGDRHIFILDRPFSGAPNVTRLVVDQRPSIRVSISDHPTSPFTFTNPIAATPSNQAPVLAAIGDRSVHGGDELTLTAWATDLDWPRDVLAFSLDAGAPDGATIDSDTGEFHWMPSDTQIPGVFPVTIRVSDGGAPGKEDFETFMITVDEVNLPPVLEAIGDQTVQEGSLLTFTATATDPDTPDSSLSFSLSGGAPAGATIDATTGQFRWTPEESAGPGVYAVTVLVSDNASPARDDSQTFNITVVEVNQPPQLMPIGSQSVQEGSLLTFTASASDVDLPAGNLVFSLDPGAPAGATIHAITGEFNWTPDEQAGPAVYSVTVRVTDDGSPSLDDFETISITVGEVNQPPQLAPVDNRSVQEGNLLVLTAAASDADLPANHLTFSLDAGAPSGATIDPATGEFTWMPGESAGPGVYSITVRVTDDASPALDDSQTFEISVGDVNEPPRLSTIGDRSVDEGSELRFTATASDPDIPFNNLYFSLDSGAPDGATIDPDTGEFRWTPGEADGPAVHSVTVYVTDNASIPREDSETFEITVGEVNQPPVLAQIPNHTVDEGSLLAFPVSATDADLPANQLVFSLDANAPTGATIDPETGEFRWIPSAGTAPAVYSVTVNVSDAGTPNQSDSQTIEITVYDPLDVNRDHNVSALDALAIINQIDRMLYESEDASGTGNQPVYHYDANNDGRVSALDALMVINHLSAISHEAEFADRAICPFDGLSSLHDHSHDDDLMKLLADDQILADLASQLVKLKN